MSQNVKNANNIFVHQSENEEQIFRDGNNWSFEPKVQFSFNFLYFIEFRKGVQNKPTIYTVLIDRRPHYRRRLQSLFIFDQAK